MKKEFRDLTPNDFPGVDPVKFEEWKRVKETTNRNTVIFFIFFIISNIILLVTLKSIWFGGFLLILILFFINNKFNRLSKELGITPNMTRQALKGEPVNGFTAKQPDEIALTADHPEIKKRPIAITVICILGFIGVVFAIPTIFSHEASQIGSWYPPYLGFSTMAGLICMIGLWKMKRWAAYTYIGFVALNQIVMLTKDVWSPMALVIPLIVIVITLAFIKKMD